MWKWTKLVGKLESRDQWSCYCQGLYDNCIVWRRGGPALLTALGFVSACQITCSEVLVWLLQPRLLCQGALLPITLQEIGIIFFHLPGRVTVFMEQWGRRPGVRAQSYQLKNWQQAGSIGLTKQLSWVGLYFKDVKGLTWNCPPGRQPNSVWLCHFWVMVGSRLGCKESLSQD